MERIASFTMALVLFWTSANMKNTAKDQLRGILVLFALGFLSINSPIILVAEAIAIILLVVWIFAYRKLFLKGQFTVILLFLALQVGYYMLFFVTMGSENNLTLTLLLLCIFPILSLLLLYPWTFGQKKTRMAASARAQSRYRTP